MKHWSYESIFYHIYPLGLCGAPQNNDFRSAPVPRLNVIRKWIDHMRSLGVNALYLGPLFESARHGYDTADYLTVDRRLGDNRLLAELVSELHRNGIRVILDGVFHHVGRDFWAFRTLLSRGQSSEYCEWFDGIDFDRPGACGTPFSYNCWNGHYSLVKLNHQSSSLRDYLLKAVERWIAEFDIDGLRLDVADLLDLDFQKALARHCKNLKSDFWLMGEVIHGDYRKWVNSETIDSVTNYENYKGLFSSHNDGNYFEIAYSLDRQFGPSGLYRDLPLYSFVDNHDVNRIASTLKDSSHLYPLHCILFTMPGVPSIYYGSEWGISGRKENGDDNALRPFLNIDESPGTSANPDLKKAITKLAGIRKSSLALKYGGYKQLHVSGLQLAFLRESEGEKVVVAVNSADEKISLDLKVPGATGAAYSDLLNEGEQIFSADGILKVDIHPCWARILQME
jgi:glycosidase